MPPYMHNASSKFAAVPEDDDKILDLQDGDTIMYEFRPSSQVPAGSNQILIEFTNAADSWWKALTLHSEKGNYFVGEVLREGHLHL